MTWLRLIGAEAAASASCPGRPPCARPARAHPAPGCPCRASPTTSGPALRVWTAVRARVRRPARLPPARGRRRERIRERDGEGRVTRASTDSRRLRRTATAFLRKLKVTHPTHRHLDRQFPTPAPAVPTPKRRCASTVPLDPTRQRGSPPRSPQRLPHPRCKGSGSSRQRPGSSGTHLPRSESTCRPLNRALLPTVATVTAEAGERLTAVNVAPVTPSPQAPELPFGERSL